MSSGIRVVMVTIYSLILLSLLVHQTIAQKQRETNEMKDLRKIVGNIYCKKIENARRNKGAVSFQAVLNQANSQCEKGLEKFLKMPVDFQTSCMGATKPAECQNNNCMIMANGNKVPLEDCAQKLMAFYAEKEGLKPQKGLIGARPGPVVPPRPGPVVPPRPPSVGVGTTPYSVVLQPPRTVTSTTGTMQRGCLLPAAGWQPNSQPNRLQPYSQPNRLQPYSQPNRPPTGGLPSGFTTHRSYTLPDSPYGRTKKPDGSERTYSIDQRNSRPSNGLISPNGFRIHSGGF